MLFLLVIEIDWDILRFVIVSSHLVDVERDQSGTSEPSKNLHVNYKNYDHQQSAIDLDDARESGFRTQTYRSRISMISNFSRLETKQKRHGLSNMWQRILQSESL